MDLQKLVDSFVPIACVLSVEKLPDGGYGEIRIVTGNKAYLDIASEYKKVDAAHMCAVDFVPDSLYERYMPKDLNFEDDCYRCAVKGQSIHSYVCPERLPFWLNITMLPIASDDPSKAYCLFTQEFTKKADYDMITDISPENAARVLKTCFKLRDTDDFNSAIDEVIHDIRDLCDADHCCILLSDFSKRTCSVLCEALSKDTNLLSMKHYVDDKFFTVVETWPDTIAGSTCFIINEPSDWDVLRERNPIWYESMSSAGAKSIVLFPLNFRDETVGFIWAINFDVTQTHKIIETLELTSFFVAAEIANYNMIEKLDMLSRTDMLTGVLNRNAMNSRMDELSSADERHNGNIGVFFADINGLKYVNDTLGHHEGDEFLREAARILRQQFADCEIYRAGGDEFMMISTKLTAAEMDERVRRLRETTVGSEKMSFSVGSCMTEKKDIQKAMIEADRQMYEDKKRFYRRSPDKKR